ncbi:MAG TPA: N-acetylmuramic acid 6-phosphate etherase [Rhizomicrobium sp.]|nr:N-acetylmuramic acid 6-phosphate etherase [Rhizomicrobium sp.]
MRTETVDPRFVDIDSWPAALAVEAMLDGQLSAVASLYSQIGAIAAAGDAAATRLCKGGRLVYVGAGTSGRIAVQDGVELSPTYDWPENRLVFALAGGMPALSESVEGAEDDRNDAIAQIKGAAVSVNDVVIGVAASGHTPFTVAAIQQARADGALTIGVANNAGTPLLLEAEHGLLADTGSELIAGSTRMKAGTAQKALLNILSTVIMLRCGLIYKGLMVNMRVSNVKLEARARSIIQQITGVDAGTADAAMKRADGSIKKAVLIASGLGPDQAEELLRQNGENLRAALSQHSSMGV